MRRSVHALAIAAGLVPCLTAAAGESPGAQLERRLERLLDPTAQLDLRGFATEPRPRRGPSWLEQPEVPLTRLEALPPEVPIPARGETRPRLSPEPAALSYYLVAAEVPQRPRLPAGPLARQDGLDPLTPPPLPTLGNYVTDRVSVGEPSLDASVALTRTPQMPARTAEVPFTPWNLPDPFEHAAVVRLRQPWTESPDLPLFPVAPTRR